MKLKQLLKKLFNKADRNDGKNGINNPNEVNTIVKLPLYAPNFDITPISYYDTAFFNNMMQNFKSICLDYLSKSHPDEYTSSYMDAVIERAVLENKEGLKIQSIDHKHLIKDAIASMREGDLHYAGKMLEYYENDRSSKVKERNKLQTIYWAGTSLAEDKED